MNSFVLTVDNLISDTDLIDELYDLVVKGEFSLPTNSFYPIRNAIDQNYKPDDRPNEIIYSFIRSIWLNKLRHLILSQTKKVEGFEVWINSLPETNFNNPKLAGGIGGLNYHVDRDENASRRGEFHLPIFANAFYLGPREGINGGEIVLNTRGIDHFNEYKGGLIDLGENKGWVSVPFKYNRMVIFDSTYPHFVKPIVAMPDNKPRVTMAINVWHRQIG